ncbi:MAG: histidinol-phosphate transaminase [Elusimicrobiota bacterium]
MSNKFVRKRIRDFKPYEVSEIDEGEIKLDAQENPYSIPEEVTARIKEAIVDLSFNRYPDPSYMELRNMISSYCGVKSSNILLGNGSDELILSLLLASAGEGRRVAAPSPTFSMYGILARLTGSSYIECALKKGFELDVPKLLELEADVTFIAYPNNPTGNCYKRKDMEHLIKSSSGMVVVDEAYYEFSGKSFATLVDEYENLVVLRTFSKAFALAGIRAGYLICNEGLAHEFRKAQLPYNLSALNEEILKIILSKRRRILDSVELLISSKNAMEQKLRKLPGIEVYPSDANFILLKINKINRVVDSMRRNKIRVREFSEPGLRNYLRVSVGAGSENRKFIKAMEESL